MWWASQGVYSICLKHVLQMNCRMHLCKLKQRVNWWKRNRLSYHWEKLHGSQWDNVWRKVTGRVPQGWKQSVPKTLLHVHQIASYRPVSLLSVLSKVLERHMYSIITNHLQTFHSLAESRWGLLPGNLTVSYWLASNDAQLVEYTRGWWQDWCVLSFLI